MFLDQPAGFGEVGVRGVPRIRRFLNPQSAIPNPQSKEPRPVQVDVGEEEGHGAALGDFPGFVQVALRARLAVHRLLLLVAGRADLWAFSL